jgi:hypothetical protein
MTVREDFTKHLETLEKAGYTNVAGSLRQVHEVVSKYTSDHPEEDDQVTEVLMKAFPPPEEEEEAPPEEEAKGTPCPECGAMNEPGATECASCGAPMGSSEESPDANPEEQGMQDPAAQEEQAVKKVQMIVVDLLEELGLVEKAGGVVKAVDMKATTMALHKNTQAGVRTLAGDVAQLSVLLDELTEELAKRIGGQGPVLRDIGTLIPGYLEKAAEADSLQKAIDAESNPLVKERLQQQLSRLNISLQQSRQLSSPT